MRRPSEIPSDVEEFRDERWRREGALAVESAADAERFIEQVGFAACLTHPRRPGPSLYIAVCGRRDAVKPRHIQKDPETSLTSIGSISAVGRGTYRPFSDVHPSGSPPPTPRLRSSL